MNELALMIGSSVACCEANMARIPLEEKIDWRHEYARSFFFIA